MREIDIDTVESIRRNFGDARRIAATRFREDFDLHSDLPPNERWRSHLEIQAAALLEKSHHVSLQRGMVVRYRFLDDRLVQPFIISAAEPRIEKNDCLLDRDFFPFFSIENTPAGLLEYWMLTSELSASPAWPLTRLIASVAEYESALKTMTLPDVVRALVVSWLPRGEWHDDGTARLEVVVYCRAGEERVERRELLLDRSQQLHFHGRELIAEGRGGVVI